MSLFTRSPDFGSAAAGKLRQTYRSLKTLVLFQTQLAKLPVSRLQPDVYFTTSGKMR